MMAFNSDSHRIGFNDRFNVLWDRRNLFRAGRIPSGKSCTSLLSTNISCNIFLLTLENFENVYSTSGVSSLQMYEPYGCLTSISVFILCVMLCVQMVGVCMSGCVFGVLGLLFLLCKALFLCHGV